MENLERHEELIHTDLKEKAAQFQKLQDLEKEAQQRINETQGRLEATHAAYETVHKQLHGTATDLRRHTDEIIKKDDPIFLIETLKTSLKGKELPKEVNEMAEALSKRLVEVLSE